MRQRVNHYERAFRAWLARHEIPYTAVSQAQKAQVAGAKLKSFDLIVYPRCKGRLIVDVKGRKLPAGAWRQRRWGQSWTTAEDLIGLQGWEEVFGRDYLGIFVFAYWVVGVEPDEADLADICLDGRHYVFVAAERCGYQVRCKPRSPRWGTVFVPAKPFDNLVQPFGRFIGLRPTYTMRRQEGSPQRTQSTQRNFLTG